MIRHFFQDLQRMQPADYGDVAKWSEDRGLGWTQAQIVTATSILAKLRGQLRPLRFEKYSLDEFTIGPARCVVPTEYRVEVLRSWRRLVRKDLGWRDILIDIWRLACLEQVAEGRHAGLFRVGAMIEYLQECIPFLERLEQTIQDSFLDEDIDEITVNPEVAPDGLSPTGCDMLIGRRLIRICGEKKPDMYMWAETWLSAYLFVACGLCRPITRIQMLHPFYGLLLSHEPVNLARARSLYEHLLGVWDSKQA
jgi:hypothetical protein